MPHLTYFIFLLLLGSCASSNLFWLRLSNAVHKFLYYTDIAIFVISPYLILLEEFRPYSNNRPGYSFILYFYGYSLFLCPYYYIVETASFPFCCRLSVNAFFAPSCLSLLIHTFLKSIFLVLSFPPNSQLLSPKFALHCYIFSIWNIGNEKRC